MELLNNHWNGWAHQYNICPTAGHRHPMCRKYKGTDSHVVLLRIGDDVNQSYIFIVEKLAYLMQVALSVLMFSFTIEHVVIALKTVNYK